MARGEIDPQLPFIQVHRSVGAKAAQVASALGVTYQHARGALECFWEGLADRRMLINPDGSVKEAVVLAPDEAGRRLRMAFGGQVDAELMVSAGFLQPAEGGFRVRGMSPYLNSERGRKAKKSTPTPPKSHGDATPVPSGRHPGATPTPPGCDPGATQDDTPVPPHRGERLEVRGETLTAAATAPPPVPPLPKPPADKFSSGDAFWAWVQGERVASTMGLTPEKRPHPDKLRTWFSSAMMAVNGDTDAFLGVFKLWVQDAYWREQGWPFRGLMAQWSEYHSKLRAQVPGAST